MKSATPSPGPAQFRTTHWSVVLAAGGAPSSPEAKAALETLCRAYWPPLYAFLRRRGHDVHAAQDLTQGFFARLLEKGDLRLPDPARGRFRSFLLAALRHYEANEWDRDRAQKRGGGADPVPLHPELAESAYGRHAAHEETAERTYDRCWALATLDRALIGVGQEYAQTGRNRLFDVLKPYLVGDPMAAGHREAASALQISVSAVKVSVHRLRRRFRDLLRAEIAQTVERPEEVEDEIRALFAAIS